MSHETDEQLELYALGRLSESHMEAVEEHLVLCVSCRQRLDEVEVFALAMRRAIGAEPATEPGRAWFGWLRQPAMLGSLGFAAILLAAGLYLSLGRSHGVAPLASLQLTAMRGEVQSVGVARETDITLADASTGDVPPGDAPPGRLRAEVVDAAGSPVWSGPIDGNSGRIRLTMRLAVSSYFVRLYDDTGQLLHEYAFRVDGAL